MADPLTPEDAEIASRMGATPEQFQSRPDDYRNLFYKQEALRSHFKLEEERKAKEPPLLDQAGSAISNLFGSSPPPEANASVPPPAGPPIHDVSAAALAEGMANAPMKGLPPGMPSFQALTEGRDIRPPTPVPATVDTPFEIMGQPLQAPNPAAPPAGTAPSGPPGPPGLVGDVQVGKITSGAPPAAQGAPAGPQGPSELARLRKLQGISQEAQDIAGVAAQAAHGHTEAELAKQMVRDNAKAQTIQDDFNNAYKVSQDRYRALSDRSAQLAEQLATASVDPNHYYKSRGAAEATSSAISITLYSILQATGAMQGNPGLDMLNKAIDRDIDAQKGAIESKMKAMGQFGQLGRDEMANQAEMRMYEHTMRESHWQVAENRLKEMAKRMGIPEDDAKFLQTMAVTEENRIKEKIAAEKARIAAAVSEAHFQQARIDKQRSEALTALVGMYPHAQAGVPVTALETNLLSLASGKTPEGGLPSLATPGPKGSPEAKKAADEKEAAIRAYHAVMPMYDQWSTISQQFSSKVGVGPLKTDAKRFMDSAERQVRIAVAPAVARLGLGSEAEGQLIADMIPDYMDSQQTLANKRSLFEMYAGKPLSDAELAHERARLGK